ncbi:MAG TPA: potassium channel family protein, partial [bacterium]|nr:potassium channel family protein [bacterium]
LAITMVHGSFIVTAVVIFIRNIFREKNVTTDTILGGIAVYFLIGILWALFYRAAILINPHSLSIAVAQSHHYVTDLLYFSFSTLTTLGYGDIVAETAFTKNLAVLEGALGQIYLAVFVARLVGLHLSTRQN